VTALKNLSLNIRRAKLAKEGETRFYVTEAVTSEKVCGQGVAADL
jgi:hypothetical protein